MPLHPGWPDIALRLALTLAASAAIGLDRGASGHRAGLRTTILVGLAAAAAMIQANLLLDVGGKTSSSFSVLDLMRLPLGILTGVGFIGGGAILKRGDIVTGVTTAATLWVTTVIALCLGGGQLGLGCATTVLTILTLRALKIAEGRMPRQRRARVEIEAPADASLVSVAESLAPAGYAIRFRGETQAEDSGAIRYGFEVCWRQLPAEGAPIDLIEHVRRRHRLIEFAFLGEGAE